MKRSLQVFLAMAALVCASALADDFDDTTAVFKNAGQSASFFTNSYGYAVFPNIAKGGLGVGAAHGKGRVYQQGKYVGDTSMTQVSIGLQAGGQAYSQIVFMEDKRSFDEFTSGNFGFDASVGAVAITASAGANASTQGGGTTTSAGKNDATTKGQYRKGMAVFTVVKGGAMYEASVAGQKFSYKPK
jgi:lipid-binding SYLF domain-containing protein